MFNDQERNAYQRIQAPDALRQRVLAQQSIPAQERAAERIPFAALKKGETHASKLRQLRRYTSIAACAVLVIALSAMLLYGQNRTDSIQLSLNGQILTTSPVAIAETSAFSSRGIAPMTADAGPLTVPVALKLASNQTAKVTAADHAGSISILDAQTGACLQSGTDCTAQNGQQILWEIPNPDPTAPDGTYVLTVRCETDTQTVTLAFDPAANQWTVCNGFNDK